MLSILAVFSYCCWLILVLMFLKALTECAFDLTNVLVCGVFIAGQFIYDTTLFHVKGRVFGMYRYVVDFVYLLVVHVDVVFFEDPQELL